MNHERNVELSKTKWKDFSYDELKILEMVFNFFDVYETNLSTQMIEVYETLEDEVGGQTSLIEIERIRTE